MGSADAAAGHHAPKLPVHEIETIIGAKGTVTDGVLNLQINRDDLPGMHKQGVPIKPSFEINGNLCFQRLSKHPK